MQTGAAEARLLDRCWLDDSAGLGAVAKNVDSRTSQMKDVHWDWKSGVGDRITSMGNANKAQAYLAQAMKNAQEAGMTPNEIQQILQQNMGQNFNTTYDGKMSLGIIYKG